MMMRTRTAAFIAFCAASMGSTALPTPARANLVLFGGSVGTSFTDLGALGFGNAPRLLTLQNGPTESGQIVFTGGVAAPASFAGQNNVVSPCCDGSTNSAPTLGSLGWTSGANVGIGFNSDQEGQTGITLNQLILSLYNNANTVVGTFSLAAPITFTAPQLALQLGNGNGVFEFVLTSSEQAQFNALLVGNFSTFHIALASQLGVGGLPSNDGPDSFLAIRTVTVPVPGPIVGAGLPGLVLACGGLLAWARRRKTVPVAA
jgi:hypothetical protein